MDGILDSRGQLQHLIDILHTKLPDERQNMKITFWDKLYTIHLFLCIWKAQKIRELEAPKQIPQLFPQYFSNMNVFSNGLLQQFLKIKHLLPTTNTLKYRNNFCTFFLWETLPTHSWTFIQAPLVVVELTECTWSKIINALRHSLIQTDLSTVTL